MERIEKSVFISYRRKNFPWALAVWQNLTQHGFDVFLDYEGIASGDFESVILENIIARAHFLIILTPSALERCSESNDLMRREVETALSNNRNIVSLMLEGFSFGTPAIASQLIGSLEPVKRYNALSVPNEYFHPAMEKLRRRFLDVPLTAVIHPPSSSAQQAAVNQNAAAVAAPQVREEELTAQQYYERGVASTDPDERIRFFSEAIRLEPNFAGAYNERGNAHFTKDDFDSALTDYTEAIRLGNNFFEAFYNRAYALDAKGDLDGAVDYYSRAMQLNPDHSFTYYNRGRVLRLKRQNRAALADFRRFLELSGDTGETREIVLKSIEYLESNPEFDGQ